MTNPRKHFPFQRMVFLFLTLLLMLNHQSCNKPERLVSLSTDETYSLYTTCIVEGTLVDLGDEDIEAHGFCYSESEEPGIEDLSIDLGLAITAGEFADTLRNLSTDTKYYVRAYAKDINEVYYGEELSFTTLPQTIPTVETVDPTIVKENSTACGGEVIYDGGSEVTQRGVCWSLSTDPEYVSQGDVTSDGSGLGSFTSNITGLEQSREYFVRAYAINSVGVGYGSAKSFTTLSVNNAPGVTTAAEASSVTDSSATITGSVTDDGGLTVTEKGVAYSEEQNPNPDEILSIDVQDGSGVGGITANLTNLTPETKYYTRAYARNSAGLGFGDEISFTTLAAKTVPLVSTEYASAVTDSSAQIGMNYQNDGGGSVSEIGLLWGLSPDPATQGTKLQFGIVPGQTFTTISNLFSDTVYYYVGYATNEIGTGYGEVKSFRTLKLVVADWEGNEYETLEIGSQVWMAKNLRSAYYADGTAITLVEDNSTFGNLDYTDKAYCYYDNITDNFHSFGMMYTWAAVMNGSTTEGAQGVCPNGWHVPSNDEWIVLVDFLGGEEVAGGKLKESGTTHWSFPNNGATNESGFNALPGGYRYHLGNYSSIYNSAYFWTSTQSSASSAWYKYLYYNSTDVTTTGLNMDSGSYVRCVKD